MCHWGRWKRTNELTLTPIHLRTTTFSFQPAYFIKLRAKVISNKKPLVHLHSQQGGSVHAATYIMFALTTHPSFSPWRNGPTKFRVQHVCSVSWWGAGGSERTDLYHWGCSRLSILSCSCFSGCPTAGGRAQLGVDVVLRCHWEINFDANVIAVQGGCTLWVRVPSRLLEMVETTLHWATVW